MKPVFELCVFNPRDRANFAIAARSGNSDARVWVNIMSGWIAEISKKGIDEKPLCLNCDAVCNDDPSWSIAVLRPFAVKEGKAVIAGICPNCMARRDLKQIVNRHFMELCGGGTVLEEGRS